MPLFECGGSTLLENKIVTPKPSTDVVYKASSDGYDGYEQVTVSKYALGTKEFNQNGTFTVLSGDKCYSSVKVNVAVDSLFTQLWYNGSGVVLGPYGPGSTGGESVDNGCTLNANARNNVGDNRIVDLTGAVWSQFKYIWVRTIGPEAGHSRVTSDVILTINGGDVYWGFPLYQHASEMHGKATSSTIRFDWRSADAGNNGRPLLVGLWGAK